MTKPATVVRPWIGCNQGCAGFLERASPSRAWSTRPRAAKRCGRPTRRTTPPWSAGRFSWWARARRASKALARPWDLGFHVAFYDTIGAWSAVSVAEHLARLGKRVTLFVPAAAFAWNISLYSKPAVAERLRASGPPRARDNLGRAVTEAAIDVFRVGECVAPRSALEAVYEGHAAARAL